MSRSAPSRKRQDRRVVPPAAPRAEAFRAELATFASPKHAAILQRFFKTAPGQYGEGDRFIGLKVPQIRSVARRFGQMTPQEASLLVTSPIHEERLGGLMVWVHAFEAGTPATRERIFNLYLRHMRHINNWDLVDLSAPQIVGGWLSARDMPLLKAMAKSDVIWERRIAVLATFAFIRRDKYAPTLQLCRMLLKDPHDLMHKACGWMLREVGKRDRKTLSAFLDQHAARMPRTMLRYTLEHYDAKSRLRYMNMGR